MNKIVLITGASKGIGNALCKKMLDENHIVIGTSRNGVIDSIEDKNFHSIALDLSKPESIEKAIDHLINKFDTIDILINNAGIGPDLDSFLPQQDSFNSTFEVNVTGTVLFTEKLIDKISKNGIILNVSSKMGSVSVCENTDSIAYRMSKSALNMYTKILTNRLKDQIKVAAIHPGWVKTMIIESNMQNGRLTPEESAENMYQFIRSDFASGTYWDSESGTNLEW